MFSTIAVVASKALHYGLARMLSAYAESEGLELSAFRTEAAALEWLAASPV